MVEIPIYDKSDLGITAVLLFTGLAGYFAGGGDAVGAGVIVATTTVTLLLAETGHLILRGRTIGENAS